MGTIDKSVYVSHRYKYNSGTINWTQAARVSKYTRTRSGVSNVHWREQIANHANAGTNLTGTWDSLSEQSIKSRKDSNAAQPYKAEGYFLGVQYPHPQSTEGDLLGDVAEMQAVMTAYKQIRKADRMFSGGVFLGELRETLHMLRNPAKALLDGLGSYLTKVSRAKQLRSIRNAKFRKLATGSERKRLLRESQDQFKDAISQSWLEGAFGWNPLIHDLMDASKAYNAFAESSNEARYEKIKAVGKSDAYYLSASTNPSIGGNFMHLVNRQRIQKGVFIIRGEVLVLPELTMIRKAERLGFAMNDFLPTVWELIPWSFLVDYFVNIGDVLDATTTDLSGVQWLVGTSVKEKIFQASCRPAPKSMQPDSSHVTFVSGNQANLTYKRRAVSRSGQYQLAHPRVVFRLPTLPLQQANMLALFTQANSVHPQRFKFRTA